MESSYGPNSIDEASMCYKLQRKVKLFNTCNPLPNRGYSLIASSSKYGIVFVAIPDGLLLVYQLKDLVDKDCVPQHVTIKLQERATHIAVSCDQELLAVTGGQLLSIYKVSNFQNPNPSSLDIRTEVGQSTFVSGIQWNPIIPDNVAMVFFDGTLLVAHIGSGPQVKRVQSKARCLCWSPKGKQLVTGNSDGTLTQYKPDLTPAKNIPAPKLIENGAPVEALAIYWISTFVFAVVFKNALDDSRPHVTTVNIPKGLPAHCLNYEETCFSMATNRPWFYYLLGIPQWSVILAASSNSMEIATLGCKKEGDVWCQWCQSDEYRPELPLTDNKIENLPIGFCIDTCALYQIPWGENQTLPFMPLIHVLTHTGLLIIFNVINMNKDALQVCTTPQQLALPASIMSNEIPGEQPAPAQPPPKAAVRTELLIPAQIGKGNDLAPVHSTLEMGSVQMSSTPFQRQTPSTSMPQAQFAPTSQVAPSLFAQVSQVPQTQIAPTPQAPTQFTPTQTQKLQATVPPPQYSASVLNIPKPPSYMQAPVNQAPAPVQTETKQSLETKPSSVVQPKATPATAAPTPQPSAPKPQTAQQAQENAALKAEQEKINEKKANQELKNMLVKEVNDFQMELYKFMVKSRETQTKLQRDIDSINANFQFSLDSEQLKKECSLDDLRGAIIQLKLELVRACAVVAEARTHAEAKDCHQWTQADPLTTKRVSSVKKLAYYVQNQLEQAQKSLDFKWNEALSRDPQFNKRGQRMIRPILDDVYQPLVKQQEILGRQQAVLRTLKNTLKDCDVTPMFKSTSLLRNTPFKKDPLSKLTKNILNMSIEPDKPKEPLLSSQKLDALRDMLSNHKTVKIKPAHVEVRQHLATLKSNYEKSLKEKAQAVKSQPAAQPQVKPVQSQPQASVVAKTEMKIESKQDQKPLPISIPSFSPVGGIKPGPGLANVARTLFTDEPKSEPSKPIQAPQPQYHPKTPVTPQSSPPKNTRSVLKDLLQNKQASLEAKANEAKNDANTFMGQNICSPLSFAFSSTTTAAPTATRTTAFTAKPISDINNMFNKFQPQAFASETKASFTQEAKPQESKPAFTEAKGLTQEPKTPTPVVASKSSETGEPESSKTFTLKPKTDKPITNLFGMKTSTPIPNVPDVLKTSQEIKAESKVIPKPVEKENLPKEDTSKGVLKPAAKEAPKPLTVQANKTSIFGSIPQSTSVSSSLIPTETKPSETKTDTKDENEKVTEKPVTPTSNASSIFAAGNATIPSAHKPRPADSITKPDVTTVKEEPVTPEPVPSESTASIFSTSTTPSAASIFGSAVASQPATTQGISIFSTPSSPTSVFGTATQGSIFGSSQPSISTSTTEPSNTTPKPSVFSTPIPASPPSVFGSGTTQSGSIFGSSFTTSTTTQSTTSVFGSSTGSIFGSTATPSSGFGSSTATPSVFSTAVTTQASIFGSVSTTPSAFTPTTTQASVFGLTTATTKSSLFGTSGGSVFAAASPNANQTSVFGSPTQASSVFGSPTSTTQPSVFGGPGTPTTQTSVFGTPTATTQPSVFGSPQPSSVFGTPPATTTQSGSLFGGGEANLFAAASISTTSAPSQTSGGSMFAGSPSGSVFGNNNTNVFGSKTAFGQSNQTTPSLFGSGGATTFGQKPGGSFWSTDNSGNTEGAFGLSSGFGQQATTQASSIFGGSTGGSFSSPSPATQAFGSPQQGGFGSPTQQAGSAPAFGGSPVFGTKSVFGSSASFGSPIGGGFGSSFGGGFNKSPGGGFGAPAAFGGGATFGGAPAFGSTSPSKVFGGAAPAPAFSSTQSNATFESLATQNTLTFGNLAQQSGQPQQPAPSFNTSPSFTGWRG